MPENGPDQPLTVMAPAKVNLALEVLGRRPDGYHEIRTVMQAVSLFDELEFRSAPTDGVELECDAPGVPGDERNLVMQAAELLRERADVGRGVRVGLRKSIPAGGGLGGGSSDCAVTLLALNQFWDLQLPVEALAEVAAGLGSDIPFFLYGGTSLCEGRGEKVRPVPAEGEIHYALALPEMSVSTADVYAGWQNGLTSRDSASNNVLEALACGDVGLLTAALHNDLQEKAFELHDGLRSLHEDLERVTEPVGLQRWLLAGSGSSFFAPSESERAVRRAARLVRAELDVPCVAAHSLPAWNGRILLLTRWR